MRRKWFKCTRHKEDINDSVPAGKWKLLKPNYDVHVHVYDLGHLVSHTDGSKVMTRFAHEMCTNQFYEYTATVSLLPKQAVL